MATPAETYRSSSTNSDDFSDLFDLFEPAKPDHQIHLYHFTDHSNLELIEKHQGLWSLRELIAQEITPNACGSDNLSRALDQQLGIDAFVHLTLTPRPPMAFVAKKQGRLPNPIVITVNADVLQQANVYFAPDTANKRYVPIYPIAQLREYIDIARVNQYADCHYTSLDAADQQARRAEILVPRHIALASLLSYQHL